MPRTIDQSPTSAVGATLRDFPLGPSTPHPFLVDDLAIAIVEPARMLARVPSRDPHHDALTPAAMDDAFGNLLGHSAGMLELRRRIRRAAATDATVLLSGETGTGKELAARAVHDLGRRRRGAFVALNCGAVSAMLIESELFGHERGSFTGADRLHHGVFARAHGGTLFLDEIAEMPPELQVRLLRVLDSGTFQRIGGEQMLRTDARIIAATNRPPLLAVRSGLLREDLYYRLHVVPISLPPLRERHGDVLLLAAHFLARHNHQHLTQRAFTGPALVRLRQHQWPGNVRELENFVHQAYLMADHDIGAAELASHLPTVATAVHFEITVGMSMAAAEHQLIVATLIHCEGNKTAAATVLGISLKTLYSRLGLYAAAAAAAALRA